MVLASLLHCILSD
jgi:hypothetical protein